MSLFDIEHLYIRPLAPCRILLAWVRASKSNAKGEEAAEVFASDIGAVTCESTNRK